MESQISQNCDVLEKRKKLNRESEKVYIIYNHFTRFVAFHSEEILKKSAVQPIMILASELTKDDFDDIIAHTGWEYTAIDLCQKKLRDKAMSENWGILKLLDYLYRHPSSWSLVTILQDKQMFGWDENRINDFIPKTVRKIKRENERFM